MSFEISERLATICCYSLLVICVTFLQELAQKISGLPKGNYSRSARYVLCASVQVPGVCCPVEASCIGVRCLLRVNPSKIIFLPHCPRRTMSACCRIWSRCRCRSARSIYESGEHAALCLFPHHLHRVAALRHGGRRLGGNRRGRQRGHGRHRAVHGRRNHASRAVVQSAGYGYRLKASCAEAGIRAAAGRCSTCCCAIPRR